MDITPLDIARRFVGMTEIAGTLDNPVVLEMLKLDNAWPDHDEVPWCSAFANYICHLWSRISPLLTPMPRSRDLRARSWLLVGEGVTLDEARKGYDVVILQRGGGDQPGPDVIDAPGHVGFYAGQIDGYVDLLGGNQADSVKVSRYGANRLLGVRRLYEEGAP